jgi:hypothetical protein
LGVRPKKKFIFFLFFSAPRPRISVWHGSCSEKA